MIPSRNGLIQNYPRQTIMSNPTPVASRILQRALDTGLCFLYVSSLVKHLPLDIGQNPALEEYYSVKSGGCKLACPKRGLLARGVTAAMVKDSGE
jgi:hypothetical protein